MKSSKYYLLCYIGTLLIVVTFAVVGYLFAPTSGDIAAVIIWIVGGIIALLWFSAFRNKARSTCSSCGKSLKGGEYSWQMQEAEDYYDNQGKHFVDYKYDVNCTCPHCGANKEFVDKFRCKGSENPDVYVRKYLRNIFGHKR